MKSLRMLFVVLLATLSTVALAGSNAQQSDSQKSFEEMKTLAGTWIGKVTTDPPDPEMEKGQVRVVIRITSRGNAIVHEMGDPSKQEDPTKYDHPVTMFYLDNGRLTLVHYCDAGNRPRMAGKLLPDGNQVDFSLVDLSGSNDYGHMERARFTVVDTDHHIEDWTFMMPGDKPMHARLDLQRSK